MPIGKLVSLPYAGGNWGQVRGEHGNNWNIKAKKIPEGSSPGDEVAYRLDFSSPTESPQVLLEDE